MNEHDYYIFGQISLLIGSISLLIGGFILRIFNQLTILNTFLLLFIFFIFFGIGFYYHYKKNKYDIEMREELDKYLDGGKDNDFESS